MYVVPVSCLYLQVHCVCQIMPRLITIQNCSLSMLVLPDQNMFISVAKLLCAWVMSQNMQCKKGRLHGNAAG